MTEPQELRSIDELFRNTFNNLPETPADSGWDTPSDRVWQHVQETIRTPRSGWSLQSMLILAGFAVLLAVGLYVTLTSSEKVVEQPLEPAVVNVVEAPVEAPAAAPVKAEMPAETPVTVKKQPQIRQAAKTSPEQGRPMPVAPPPASPGINRELPRTGGAAPLPGSNGVENIIPNTTEALKAERARQLELRWKTPLNLLPIPRDKKAND